MRTPGKRPRAGKRKAPGCRRQVTCTQEQLKRRQDFPVGGLEQSEDERGCGESRRLKPLKKNTRVEYEMWNEEERLFGPQWQEADLRMHTPATSQEGHG
ncbi:hypothetical protein NDU88_002244 [Pleurodeles waltl]|uniref:Uncharacterized protein n=1 Tax=Pleurodeles waltl TaxID=8319 RepID=A0AAV7W1B8_PLEWA|nr:hypothetical protein NDU88_002244 [Pleurodeles waltl]